MTEREKMAQIIAEHLCPQGKAHKTLYGAARRCYIRNNFADCEKVSECVDALLAANIGDVTEYKKTICELNIDVVAHRTLSKADILEQIIEGLKSLIVEYEHRAEVAERALRKAVSVLDAEYRAFGVNRENKTEQRIKNFIEQAEKELAEEG